MLVSRDVLDVDWFFGELDVDGCFERELFADWLSSSRLKGVDVIEIFRSWNEFSFDEPLSSVFPVSDFLTTNGFVRVWLLLFWKLKLILASGFRFTGIP